ncbi:putative metal-binding motif-containing protein [Maribacter sp.]|uniref:putative metal-binding motif-containing protein n=1 Tax=Maribacter sp. TaxID=1897614 RepID=UPI0025C3CD9E|nr:putative metal-binding motif-containing protein [Maribacter sp.]
MKSIFLKKILPFTLLILAICIIGPGCSEHDPNQYWYQDLDGDTFGNVDVSLYQELQPTGYVSNYTDCNDNDDTVYITAPEIADNGIDDNCDDIYAVTLYRDNDADGFGHVTDSQVFQLMEGDAFPDGFVNNNADCNDNDPMINPLAYEIAGNEADENCNGILDYEILYMDEDGDGYGSQKEDPAQGVPNNLDCDDTNSKIHPYAIDAPNNGIDEDCDGTIDEMF